MPLTSTPDPGRESSRRTLAYPAFRRLLLALLLTRAGNLMQTVASGWLVFQLTASPMAVGLLGFLALGPGLLGSPLGGRLADRFCPRHLAIGLSFASALGPLALAGLSVADSLSLPAIYALTVITALPYTVNLPVRAIVVPFAVPMGLRERALADVSAANNVADLFGAVAGGVIVQVTGPGLPYAFNGAAHVMTGLVLIASPLLQAACDRARDERTGGIAAALRVGLRIPVVQIMVVGTVTFFLLIAPVESLMPTLAGDHSEGAMALGFLLAGIGVGAMIGNPLVRSGIGTPRLNTRTMIIGLGLASVAVILLGWSNSLATDFALLMVFGAGWEWVSVASSNTLQLQVPFAIAGRMVGVYYLLSMGLAAIGALLLGWLFAAAGVDPSLWVVGLVAVVVTALLAGWRRTADLSPAPSGG